MSSSSTQSTKMGVVGLTIIVAVNMMGSGIIMLPASLAKVGTISLLSWIVTALGSMALAYSFAQCGFFVTRSGGMSAYAEEAHGKSSFFLASYTYYLSLAIANVAIAITAIGYLSPFVPWLSAAPVNTCIGVIALLWLTAVANFGGARITGRISGVTVWGVIIPVATLAIFGWFWFDPHLFVSAWNVQHKPFGEAISSSIALTLWAFLGMESACANSDAVENPKKNVPIAVMAGTGIAAVIYILSTAAMQGIVPNHALANSSAPFGLAFSLLFSPALGSIVSLLAVVACTGSLLGWQFTIAQVSKSAADHGMFAKVFSAVNSKDAPVKGMVIITVVQTLISLMTISPSLNQQFNALVNLAVFTNVVPYILSLTALFAIMKKHHVARATYTRNLIIVMVALVYSLYGIYAAGTDAVFWGALVMLTGYILYGLRADRFPSPVADNAH
ncbi:MAG: putrescine-ornithine antiporter [Paludibacterium sp.]|uniref:putrescine-ornithine antiporter n=1 Tax=Paludibacterium sp. TaxID=1917523 RepID=UPI0025EAF9D1|nr:putrescine-ornithine antiporter [Paludibacterium sp.]MBV8048946.1 putrescine-ornithine antiporter [Paludibacterium sp.]MBV8646624.1 putrescine-ornithine antiporter [Paludibacterium sp.]